MTNEIGPNSSNTVLSGNLPALTKMNVVDTPAVRFLVCGDICGWFNDLARDLERIEAHQGPFALAACIGNFIGNDTVHPSIEDAIEKNDYFSGRKQFVVPVYFIDSSQSSFGSQLRTQYYNEAHQFSASLTYLGGFGFSNLFNLRIGFLSGLYDSKYFYSEPEDEEDVDLYPSNNEETNNAEAFPSKLSNRYFAGEYNEYYSQRVMQTMYELSVKNSGQTDVFFSCTWPMDYNVNLTDSKKEELEELLNLTQPLDPSTTAIKSESPALSKLIELNEPRFHIAAGASVFYQRPPYRTSNHGLTSKFIGLGNIKTATRIADRRLRFFHALVIKPLSIYADNRTVLLATPSSATESPYFKFHNPNSLVSDASHKRGTLETVLKVTNIEPLLKKNRSDSTEQARTVCVSNLPYAMTENAVTQLMSQFGEITQTKIAKYSDGKSTGRAWVMYQNAEDASNALNYSYQLSANGRTLKNSGSPWSPDRAPGHSRTHKNFMDFSPHAGERKMLHTSSDCWFCLANPKCEKQLVVALGQLVYVALAKGGLVPQHCLIVPVTHFPNAIFCPPTVIEEFEFLINAIRACYSEQRFFPMRTTTGMHMQFQVIPVPNDQALTCLEKFEEKAESAGCPLTRLNADDSIAVLRHRVPNRITQPYFYIELPENDKVARFLFVGSSDENIPFNFGREVLAEILNTPDKADWKNCVDPSHVEIQFAKDLRSKLEPFLSLKNTEN